MIKGMTINDATHKWVGEFNAIPQGMIERLMRAAPDEWEELTLPRAGSRVHVFDLPDSCDTREHLGEIVAYAAQTSTSIGWIWTAARPSLWSLIIWKS